MKKMNKKGFTLMEMLIVIAIIAILIAIAIPTFTAALEKSRQKTDLANARALKSLVVAQYMAAEGGETPVDVKAAIEATGVSDSAPAVFYLNKDGQQLCEADDLATKGMKLSSKDFITAAASDGTYGQAGYVSCAFNDDCMMVGGHPDLTKVS